ncbi:MAG: hypothetical protein ACRD44_14170 [Bryobacteraceae bacterium]
MIFVPLAGAEEPVTPEMVRHLVQRVAQLERRVSFLEDKLRETRLESASLRPAAESAALEPPHERGPNAGAVQAPRAAAPKEPVQAPELHSHPLAPTLKIAGFSDFNFSASTLPGARSGFSEGQFTLHMTSALSPRVNFFGELTFTARADAGMGSPPATGFNAEVERVSIRFDQSDYFKVSFGRYHTPVNWWNTAYHHGQWLQTTISRPEMTQFGGRFIPVHFVGAMVEGALPARGLNLNYNFGLGNGRGSVISRGGDAGDENNNRAWLVNLFVKPNRFYGLQAGGSIYRDKVPVGGRMFEEWIQSAHIVWAKENPEFIAEFANVSHREAGGTARSNSQAWYMQLGYRLPVHQQQFKPYYRFEYIHVPGSDTVFRQVPGLAASVLGLRYDISTFAALKLEYRNLRRPGLPRFHAVFASTSFTF